MNTELFWLKRIPQLVWFIGVLIPQTFLIHMGIEELAGWVLSGFTCESLDSHAMSSLLISHVNLLIHIGWVLLIHMRWILSSFHTWISWFTWDEFFWFTLKEFSLDFTCESTKSLTWWIEKVADLRDSDLFGVCTGLSSVYVGLFEVCVWRLVGSLKINPSK